MPHNQDACLIINNDTLPLKLSFSVRCVFCKVLGGKSCSDDLVDTYIYWAKTTVRLLGQTCITAFPQFCSLLLLDVTIPEFIIVWQHANYSWACA